MDPLLPSAGYCGRSECRKDKRSSSTVLYTASPGGKGGTCMSQGASRETEPVGHTHMHANTHTHSQTSLFMVVMFHKVAANTDAVNPETLLLGEHRLRLLQASSQKLVIN